MKNKSKKDYNNSKDIQIAWNKFQASMRILRKEQRQVIKEFRDRLTEQNLNKLRKDLEP